MRFLDKKTKRFSGALLHGIVFVALLGALYFLVGITFHHTRAGTQVQGSGIAHQLSRWVTPAGSTTHLQCVSNMCTSVSGAGTDTCAPVGSTCGNVTHLSCVSNTCTSVSGAGSNTCSPVGSACSTTHLECVSNTCTAVAGSGANQCTPVGSACGAVSNAPVAEAGISLDGATYSASITVQRGQSVQIWLSADKDVNGDGKASLDPDGWTNPTKGVASGGKCEWNIDLNPTFAVQDTVSNPSSPTKCNRGSLAKTFNDAPGTYRYPVLRITDAANLQSNVSMVSVRIVDSSTHFGCVAHTCTVVSGAGANACAVAGNFCTGGGGGGGVVDLIVSQAPQLASGELSEGKTVTLTGRVKNQSASSITTSFRSAFFIDINDDGKVEVLFWTAALSGLDAGGEVTVVSNPWTNIPQGTHRVYLCADSSDTITESNENNNCDSSVFTVSGASALHIDSCGPMIAGQSVTEARASTTITWSATVSGGIGTYRYSWSESASPPGDTPLNGTTTNPVSVAYRIAGTKSGSLTVRSGSQTVSRSCGTVTISAEIQNFQANPKAIKKGESTTLSWSTVGFKSCMITANQTSQSIGAVPLSGSRVVKPTLTTTYTLSCDGGSQTQAVTVTVKVNPDPIELPP